MNAEMNTHVDHAPMGGGVRHSSPAVSYFGAAAKYALSAQYGRSPNVDLARRFVETAVFGGEQFVRGSFSLRSMREDDDASPQDDGEMGGGSIAATDSPNWATKPNTVFRNPILPMGSLLEAMAANTGGQSADTVSARIDDARLAFIPVHSGANVAGWTTMNFPNWRERFGGANFASGRCKIALDEAMEDMAELDEYADEKNLPPLSPIAKEAAQTFLRKVIPQAPRRYAVSPWDDGMVVVHTQGAKGFGVGVYFNAENGASCYVTRPNGKGREAHYPWADDIPDEFVLAALRSIGS